MKTDDLITMLATHAAPVPRRAVSHRLQRALLLALPLSLAWMLLGYGVRRDLIEAMFWPMFWVRLLFSVCIGIAGYVMVHRLARPGARVRRAWLGVAVPLALIWLLALAAWLSVPAADRAALVWGQTWRSCALSIAALSLPVLVAALLALRGLAPTRPVLSGAAAGVLAGGTGATVYALHCPELAAPFLAIWYVAGIALSVLAGAVAGARVLRW
jgi:hypothetical protein